MISDLQRFKECRLIFTSTLLTSPFCVNSSYIVFLFFKQQLILLCFREPGMRINLRKYLLIGLNSVQKALQEDRLQ